MSFFLLRKLKLFQISSSFCVLNKILNFKVYAHSIFENSMVLHICCPLLNLTPLSNRCECQSSSAMTIYGWPVSQLLCNWEELSMVNSYECWLEVKIWSPSFFLHVWELATSVCYFSLRERRRIMRSPSELARTLSVGNRTYLM